MNFIFLVVFAFTCYMAVRYMMMVWKWDGGMVDPTRPPEVIRRQVTKAPHPEMADVKPGDELLVVNFSKPIDQQRDPLYEDLQRRIEDPWDEEDDDGDGDVPAILNR
tara:strand:+ start:2348 stop:2668 length:321 start_codon:yes stop_codon:yes gene_type:complete